MDQQLILDRYRPLEELGEGGFSTVTLAWDTRMQRRVAIKRMDLPRDGSGVTDHNPPGLAEARTSALLSHPSIVTVYDFATDHDEAFLIMEHVDGATLEEILDDLGGPLDLDETAAVIDAVGSALCFAHDNGVLHLDIKPANILVARDGHVKVADFGMAELSTATGHGTSFGGTVGYMPLEQLQGSRVGEATDEWALGVLAYECLTGANPFDAPDLASAALHLASFDAPLPSDYEPELRAGIDDVLLAATGPHPADRYPDVATFVSALEPLLGDPARGRRQLGELVDAYSEVDALPEGPGWERVGLWDRMQGPAGSVALRIIAAAESSWLTWAGLSPAGLQPLPVVGAAALVGFAGAVAPSLGTGLGLVAFSVGLFAQRLWLLGSAFLAGSVLWWWFVARRSAVASVVPLSAPLLGIARVPFVAPLVAGFALPPLPAAIAGLTGGIVTVLASASSASVAPYVAVNPWLLVDPQRALLGGANVAAAFSSPATWVSILGWPVAAVLMSLLCRRATRLSAFIGIALGGIALWGANVAARVIAVAMHVPEPLRQWTGTAFAVSLGASLILVALVAALGAPVRAEEEDLVSAGYDSNDD